MQKQLITDFFTESTFFRYVLVIIGIYLAQTFFKVSKSRADGSFSFKELVAGLLDYVLYFCGIIVFFLAGCLIPDVQIISINGKEYTITDALTAIAYALIVLQSVKCFKNIKDTFNVSDDDLVRSVDTINDFDVDKYYNG